MLRWTQGPGVGRLDNRRGKRGRPSLAARWPGRGEGRKRGLHAAQDPSDTELVGASGSTADLRRPPRGSGTSVLHPNAHIAGRHLGPGDTLSSASSELRPEEARLTASCLLSLQ